MSRSSLSGMKRSVLKNVAYSYINNNYQYNVEDIKTLDKHNGKKMQFLAWHMHLAYMHLDTINQWRSRGNIVT